MRNRLRLAPQGERWYNGTRSNKRSPANEEKNLHNLTFYNWNAYMDFAGKHG